MTATKRERGAAAVETSLVLGLLLMIALGAFEYGMAFRDWLSVTQATREGVRLAANSGDHVDADCLILEATAGALQALQAGETRQVWIYESDTNGTVGSSRQRYRPANSSDTSNLLNCSTSTWVRLQNGWQPSSRDNDGATRDWIGVRVRFRYDWITGFPPWSGDVTWNDDAVMHMEPAFDF